MNAGESKALDVELPMVCICSEEGAAEAEATMQRALASLECERDALLSNVAVGLHVDHSLVISTIWVDQWFGVSVSGRERSIFVQCDRAEDGLAAIWCHLQAVSGRTGGSDGR